MKIGVVSDTHNFFDSRIPEFFKGVDHILHAGDIGEPSILRQLELIAPVTAVCGNTDEPGFGYDMTRVVELGGRKFLVHHIVAPYNLDPKLRARIDRESPDIVVFGHTHKPFEQRIGRVLFFNPGYAGKTRFGMQRSVALLHREDEEVRSEFIPLGAAS